MVQGGPPSEVTPVLLAGATAVGKTEISLCLAERLNGEIISVDSMQVYRGMDIGTAKPAPADLQRVPHHLLDVADLRENFDPSRFLTLSKAAVQEIAGRGRVPILCGGTGLYFKVFLEGLGEAPPTDPRLRAELEATPVAELLEELRLGDPDLYRSIDKQNPRRIFRAVEVLRLTGKPFSNQRAPWTNPTVNPTATSPAFGLVRAPEDLRRRIDARVEEMFRRGLVEETQRLLREGLAENRTACQALGYRQVIEHLRGRRGLPETIELVKARTRHYAKRQMTWFRRQLSLAWLEVAPNESPSETAERLRQHLAKTPQASIGSPGFG